MHPHQIQIGDAVVIAGNWEPFGAVREIHRGARPSLTVWIENYGEAELAGTCVENVHDGKVVVIFDRLPPELREYIGHAHDAEIRS